MKKSLLAEDERAVSEVMGTFLAVSITVLLVSAVAASILGMADSKANAITTAEARYMLIIKLSCHTPVAMPFPPPT